MKINEIKELNNLKNINILDKNNELITMTQDVFSLYDELLQSDVMICEIDYEREKANVKINYLLPKKLTKESIKNAIEKGFESTCIISNLSILQIPNINNYFDYEEFKEFICEEFCNDWYDTTIDMINFLKNMDNMDNVIFMDDNYKPIELTNDELFERICKENNIEE